MNPVKVYTVPDLELDKYKEQLEQEKSENAYMWGDEPDSSEEPDVSTLQDPTDVLRVVTSPTTCQEPVDDYTATTYELDDSKPHYVTSHQGFNHISAADVEHVYNTLLSGENVWYRDDSATLEPKNNKILDSFSSQRYINAPPFTAIINGKVLRTTVGLRWDFRTPHAVNAYVTCLAYVIITSNDASLEMAQEESYSSYPQPTIPSGAIKVAQWQYYNNKATHYTDFISSVVVGVAGDMEIEAFRIPFKTTNSNGVVNNQVYSWKRPHPHKPDFVFATMMNEDGWHDAAASYVDAHTVVHGQTGTTFQLRQIWGRNWDADSSQSVTRYISVLAIWLSTGCGKVLGRVPRSLS